MISYRKTLLSDCIRRAVEIRIWVVRICVWWEWKGDVTSNCHRCGRPGFTHPKQWLCDACKGDFGTEVEP